MLEWFKRLFKSMSGVYTITRKCTCGKYENKDCTSTVKATHIGHGQWSFEKDIPGLLSCGKFKQTLATVRKMQNNK